MKIIPKTFNLIIFWSSKFPAVKNRLDPKNRIRPWGTYIHQKNKKMTKINKNTTQGSLGIHERVQFQQTNQNGFKSSISQTSHAMEVPKRSRCGGKASATPGHFMARARGFRPAGSAAEAAGAYCGSGRLSCRAQEDRSEVCVFPLRGCVRAARGSDHAYAVYTR